MHSTQKPPNPKLGFLLKKFTEDPPMNQKLKKGTWENHENINWKKNKGRILWAKIEALENCILHTYMHGSETRTLQHRWNRSRSIPNHDEIGSLQKQSGFFSSEIAMVLVTEGLPSLFHSWLCFPTKQPGKLRKRVQQLKGNFDQIKRINKYINIKYRKRVKVVGP